MLLSLTVTALVLGVTAVFALAGYLIDRSARRHEKEQGY
jgi:hypothetical protein